MDCEPDMIKIRLIAVGKVKEEYYRNAIDEYAKRLGAFCKFEIIELKEENFKTADAAATDKILSVEGGRIKDALRGNPIAGNRRQRIPQLEETSLKNSFYACTIVPMSQHTQAAQIHANPARWF